MIAKSTTGSSFRGLANYLEGEEKIAFKEAHNLAGDQKDHYVRMMEDTASMSKAEKPVYHVSLSYSPEDTPSKDMMLEDGHQVLQALGLDDHQAIFVAHQDTDHKHLHMMINRVHPEQGRAWNAFGDHYKLRGIAKELEQQRGYEKTRLKNPDKHVELTNGEYHQLQDRGLEAMPIKAKAEFYELDKTFDQTKGWEELTQQLSELDLRIERKGRGGVLRDLQTDRTLKLSRIDSDIGRNQSFGRLEKRLGKLKEFERVKGFENQLDRYFPGIENRTLRTKFGQFARRSFGNKGGARAAKEGLEKVLSEKWKLGKTVKGFARLAGSSNPVSSAAKIGLKMAKKIVQQRELNRNRDLGMGR